MKIDKKVRNILLTCEGGIGKVVLSTAVVRAIKKQHPDKRIYVISGYPEIFMHNPNVHRTYNFNNPLYLYDDLINEETYVASVEPYKEYGYINKENHLVESWCKMLDVKFDGTAPDLFFTEKEKESAKLYVEKLKTDNKNKKVLLLQWVGGKIPEKPELEHFKAVLSAMYIRHIPLEVTKTIVEEIKDKYLILNVAHPNFPKIEDTIPCFHNLRETLALFTQVDEFIGIDSFVMHACASNQIQKKGIVCWAGTSPKKLGHEVHINLEKNVCPTPQCHRPNSYLFDMGQDKKLWTCSLGEPCTKYTSEEILANLTPYEPIIETEETKVPEIKDSEQVNKTCNIKCSGGK